MTPVLSVITPVYNAAKTMEKSLQSIRCSHPEKVELVFVDDGSTDRTSDLLASFIEKTPFRCQHIRQENQGVAAARNTALNHAEGEYLIFLDADDRFSEGAIDLILKEIGSDVDIVGWDWQTVYDGKIRHFRQADYSDAEGALRNLMGGTMKWNLWLFAVRRRMVVDNDFRFLPGADMGEDMGLMLRAFACSKRVRQIHNELYEYFAPGTDSISRQLDDKRRKEVTANLSLAESFLKSSPYAELCKTYLPYLKLYIKRPLLIGNCRDNYDLWYEWFPESNAFARKNRELPIHTRLLQWAASKRLWGLVRLYNWLFELLTGN